MTADGISAILRRSLKKLNAEAGRAATHDGSNLVVRFCVIASNGVSTGSGSDQVAVFFQS